MKSRDNYLKAVGSTHYRFVSFTPNRDVKMMKSNMELLFVMEKYGEEFFDKYFSDSLYNKFYEQILVGEKLLRNVTHTFTDGICLIQYSINQLMARRENHSIVENVLDECLRNMETIETITLKDENNKLKFDERMKDYVNHYYEKNGFSNTNKYITNSKGQINYLKMFITNNIEELLVDREIYKNTDENRMEIYNRFFPKFIKNANKTRFFAKQKRMLIEAMYASMQIHGVNWEGEFVANLVSGEFNTLGKMKIKDLVHFENHLFHNYNSLPEIELTDSEIDRRIMRNSGAIVLPALRDKSKHVDYPYVANFYLQKSKEGILDKSVFNKDYSEFTDRIFGYFDYEKEQTPSAILVGDDSVWIDIDAKLTPKLTDFLTRDGDRIFAFPKEVNGKTHYSESELRDIHRSIPSIKLTKKQQKAIVKIVSGKNSLFQTTPSGGLHILVNKEKFTNEVEFGNFSGTTWYTDHGQYVSIVVDGEELNVQFDYRTGKNNVIIQWELEGRSYSEFLTSGIDDKEELIYDKTALSEMGNHNFFKKVENRKTVESKQKEINKSDYKQKVRVGKSDWAIFSHFKDTKNLPINKEFLTGTSNIQYSFGTIIRLAGNVLKDRKGYNIEEVDRELIHLVENLKFNIQKVIPISSPLYTKISQNIKTEIDNVRLGDTLVKKENVSRFLKIFNKDLNSFESDVYTSKDRLHRERTHRSENINDTVQVITELQTKKSNIIVLDQYRKNINKTRKSFGNKIFENEKSFQTPKRELSILSNMSNDMLKYGLIISYIARINYNKSKMSLRQSIESQVREDFHRPIDGPYIEGKPANLDRQHSIRSIMFLYDGDIDLVIKDIEFASKMWIKYFIDERQKYLNPDMKENKLWLHLAKEFYSTLWYGLKGVDQSSVDFDSYYEKNRRVIDNFRGLNYKTWNFISENKLSIVRGNKSQVHIKKRELPFDGLSDEDCISIAESLMRKIVKEVSSEIVKKSVANVNHTEDFLLMNFKEVRESIIEKSLIEINLKEFKSISLDYQESLEILNELFFTLTDKFLSDENLYKEMKYQREQIWLEQVAS